MMFTLRTSLEVLNIVIADGLRNRLLMDYASIMIHRDIYTGIL